MTNDIRQGKSVKDIDTSKSRICELKIRTILNALRKLYLNLHRQVKVNGISIDLGLSLYVFNDAL